MWCQEADWLCQVCLWLLALYWAQMRRKKLIGNKPRQALGDRLCFYESFPVILPAKLAFWLRKTMGSFIMFRFLATFLHLLLWFFSITTQHHQPLSFIPSFSPHSHYSLSLLFFAHPLTNQKLFLIVAFPFKYTAVCCLHTLTSVNVCVYWTVDISKVDKCPAEKTWNH